MADTRAKVAMIGLDAADHDFITANLHELPNLKRAREAGVTRKLISTADALTGSVWPTFYTGQMPGEHGIYHHLQWDSGRMQLRRVTEDWLYCEPFWHELDRSGLRTIVIDVPMTFRPRTQHGVEVITWRSHDELTPFATSPPQLANEIRSKFGMHPLGHEIPVHHSPSEVEKIRKNLVDGAHRKGELALWLAQRQEWDFFLVVFSECHRGGHILWPGDSNATALLDVYRAVDNELGRLFDALARVAEVHVFALHGMRSNTSQEHFVPRIVELANEKFLGRESKAQRPPRKGGMVPWLREHVPASLQNAIAQAVPVSVRDWVVNHSVVDGYDWDQTTGFPILADLNAYIRLNIAGRERDGIMEAEGARTLSYRGFLEECFRSFRLPSGQPLVRDIIYPHKQFPGARSRHLPDMIITWTPEAPAQSVHSQQFGTVHAEIATGRGGNHQPDGFCISLAGLGGDDRPMHIASLAEFACRRWHPQRAPAGA